jgi:hypothetical protein
LNFLGGEGSKFLGERERGYEFSRRRREGRFELSREVDGGT